jgi:hypothetical protein
MTVKVRLVLAAALLLAASVIFHFTSARLGTILDLIYDVAPAASAEDLSTRLAWALVSLIWFGGAFLVSRELSRFQNLRGRNWGKAIVFVKTSGLFLGIVSGIVYALVFWAWLVKHPGTTPWPLPRSDRSYAADVLALLIWFIGLRIPLWNLDTSKWDFKESVLQVRAQVGAWIVGNENRLREEKFVREELERIQKARQDDVWRAREEGKREGAAENERSTREKTKAALALYEAEERAKRSSNSKDRDRKPGADKIKAFKPEADDKSDEDGGD